MIVFIVLKCFFLHLKKVKLRIGYAKFVSASIKILKITIMVKYVLVG